MQRIKQVFAYFTIVLVLVGSTGPSIYQHYCSLFGETDFQILHVEACCSADYCHEDGSKSTTSIKEQSCCSVVEISLKSDFNTPLEKSFKLHGFFPTVLHYNSSPVLKVLDKAQIHAFATDLSPPFLNGRFFKILYNSFLL